MMKRNLFLLMLLLMTTGSVFGQQTIFNVPTTDVLDHGKVYFELDASFKPNNQDAARRFYSLVPRLVVGVGHEVEIGVNLAGHMHPGTDATTIVPTVKWRFYQNEKSKVAFMAGTNFYIPVRNRAYNFGTYSYVAGSKTIGSTRLTAGGFIASKSVFAANANRGGGQFGIEHTVNNKLSLAADWITGRHASGYFTPGVIYKPHPRVTTYWTYSIGNANAARGNHLFLFELGYNFN